MTVGVRGVPTLQTVTEAGASTDKALNMLRINLSASAGQLLAYASQQIININDIVAGVLIFGDVDGNDIPVQLRGFNGTGKIDIEEQLITLTADNVVITTALTMSSVVAPFLPPRMTTVQKNGLANTKGSVIFDTTLNKLCINNGATWETVTSV